MSFFYKFSFCFILCKMNVFEFIITINNVLIYYLLYINLLEFGLISMHDHIISLFQFMEFIMFLGPVRNSRIRYYTQNDYFMNIQFQVHIKEIYSNFINIPKLLLFSFLFYFYFKLSCKKINILVQTAYNYRYVESYNINLTS